MKDTLKKLLGVYGATGREARVREMIREMIAPHVDEMKVDAMGNLIAVARGGGQGKRVMVAAHMDQIGFVVTDIDEKGFLRVHNVGGIRRHNSTNRRVVFESGLSGVLSLEERDVNLSDNAMSKLFVDIGANDRAEAEAKVSRGDVCVYAPDVFEMGDKLSGPALDDRAGCALLVEAIKAHKGKPNDLIAVFTAQEEVGCRGAVAAAYDAAPDIGIALDVTPAGDPPKGPLLPVKLGAGVAVKIMDSSLICTPRIVDKLEALAEANHIPNQREVLTAGGTDAGAINRTRSGVPSGVLSVPCRYVHSATETVSMADMEAALALLTAFLSDPTL